MALIPNNILPLMGLNPSGDIGPFTVYRTKRQGVVWFPRAPPEMPSSYLQRHQRNAWKYAARVWRAETETVRQNWKTAALLARLSISGYNLFIYYQTTKDASAIETIERHTGISLL